LRRARARIHRGLLLQQFDIVSALHTQINQI
jgi:hypothetical protein